MPLTKVTILFKQPTSFGTTGGPQINQLFGWTENYYRKNDVVADTATKVFTETLIDKRRAVLADEAWISGFRFQRVDPTGAARSYKTYKTGQAGEACDDPCNCWVYNCRSEGGFNNRREVILRGIPDARLDQGEFKPTVAYKTALRAFFKELKDSEWGFRATDLTQETVKIKTIEAGRLVHLAEDAIMGAGMDVQVLRSVAVGHRQKGIKTKIFSKDDARTLLLEDWPYGASKGGRLRKIVTPLWRGIELTDAEIDHPEVGNRDTGGPSDRPRGRQSNRYV